ncbi:MAG: SDR family NAD(P)-dependent oxidoreductase [Acidimicrobiales bacterium]
MSLITTPFGFSSTAADVIAGIDLSGKRVVVTGGASGIGVETARALSNAGASVTLGVRDVDAGARVARNLSSTARIEEVKVRQLDLTDLDSVRLFCAEWDEPLHLLINNAGVMAVPTLELSFEGYELQFATNHLGHFALTTGLHLALAAAEGARVVSVSSSAHHVSPVRFDDVDYVNRPYDPWSAYAQSKTANVLHAVEVTRRWGHEGIFANALHPGAIATNLQKHTGGLTTPERQRKTTEQGAATTVLLATSPVLDGVGGRYFEDCHEAQVVTEPTMFSGGVSPHALDHDSAAKLWDLSLAFLD